MYQVEKIESFEAAELQPYRTMRRQLEQREQGIFVAEGEKVVRRLLESNLSVVSVLLPEKWFAELEPLLAKRGEMVKVFLAEKPLLEGLTGFSMYQGLLAVGRVPQQQTIEAMLRSTAAPRLFVAADGLSSAENVGALVRNCCAFGVEALIVDKSSSSPFLRRAVRSSMGTVFQMPVIETDELLPALHFLERNGIVCVAAHPHTDGRTISEANLSSDCCVVFGSEGYGISRPVLDVCDDAVAIPMSPNVDSLNVGSAAAVFLYEAHRQRAAKARIALRINENAE